MVSSPLPAPVAALADELARLPGVVGVALGGSRATGVFREHSDWDLGLYHRGGVDPDGVRALGYEGFVSEPGAWGPIVDGGAWLTVDGIAVDVLYRDLDRVERWRAEAEAGRFDILAQTGYLAGAPTYLPVGELALGVVVCGELPRPAFPEALARTAPPRWEGAARASLMFAGLHAQGGEPVACAGMLAHAVLCAAHARLAARREWVLNEKRLVGRAGLEAVAPLLAEVGGSAAELGATVAAVGRVLGLEALRVR